MCTKFTPYRKYYARLGLSLLQLLWKTRKFKRGNYGLYLHHADKKPARRF